MIPKTSKKSLQIRLSFRSSFGYAYVSNVACLSQPPERRFNCFRHIFREVGKVPKNDSNKASKMIQQSMQHRFKNRSKNKPPKKCEKTPVSERQQKRHLTDTPKEPKLKIENRCNRHRHSDSTDATLKQHYVENDLGPAECAERLNKKSRSFADSKIAEI